MPPAPPTQPAAPRPGASPEAPGFFRAEFERRRAALRARMPQTAAIVDEARRLFGPGVELVGASEAGQTYRDPDAFAGAWQGCGEVHRLFTQAQAVAVLFPGERPRRST